MTFPLRPAPFPPAMAVRASPALLAAPRLLVLNEALACKLGFSPEALRQEPGIRFLAGQDRSSGIEPVAQAYAGHQFGQFVPQLGDGRAHLLGVLTDHTGKTVDLQLKGSGPTPFSRRGDGRAALGPVLREYLVSEAMAALGVPTTRALAALATGETVYRDNPQPGAIIARVASSHLRVGTFQYFAAREDHEALRFLCDLAIDRHYPHAREAGHSIRALYDAVVESQARLVARWMSLGFVHGVMNTDNMAISGETIDYGPCAFLDTYRHDKVFSSIDRTGRYAYGNQPRLAGWNLARLAETLLPLLAETEDDALSCAQSALARFQPLYTQAYLDAMRARLGLLEKEETDTALIADLLDILEKAELDWTQSFRALTTDVLPPALQAWTPLWHARLARENATPFSRRTMMRTENPAVIPRNHRIAAAIKAAEQGDFSLFEALLLRITHPYDDDSEYEQAPGEAEIVRETFCGT